MAIHLPAVLVLGDINLDIVFSVPAYPLEGAEVSVETSSSRLGGSGCNTAAVLSLLGARVCMSGHLGQDPFGEIALRELASVGIDSALIEQVPGSSTGFMMIAVTAGGKRTMFSFRGCNCLPADLTKLAPAVEASDWVHVSGYAFLEDRQWETTRQVVKLVSERGKPVSLDPSLEAASHVSERVLDVLPECAVLLVSRPEVAALSGTQDLNAGIDFLLKKGARTLAIKLGDQGSRVVTSTSQVEAAPLSGKPVRDTTGAGDCFNAGFLFGRLSGWAEGDCIRLGNALAYLAITSGEGVAGLRTISGLLAEAARLIGR